jgi:hypothetical protein
MTKTCNKCQIEKSTEDFHTSKARGLQAWCKVCRKELDKSYWKKRSSNSEKMKKKKVYLKERRNEFRKFIFEFLTKHPCVDCGEKDPIVLTFDHVRDKKSFDISQASNGSTSMETLIKEMEKCDVRCANCHMRKTAKDFNWFSYQLSGYS